MLLIRITSGPSGEWLANDEGAARIFEAVTFCSGPNTVCCFSTSPGALSIAEIHHLADVTQPTPPGRPWDSTEVETWAGCTTLLDYSRLIRGCVTVHRNNIQVLDLVSLHENFMLDPQPR